MPALVLFRFGPRRMAVVYGAVLTAWSAAGVVGPLWVAHLNDCYPAATSRYSFAASAGCLAVGLALPSRLSDRRGEA